MEKKGAEEFQDRMTINKDGEGEIDGKTIRELEREAMAAQSEKIRNNRFGKHLEKCLVKKLTKKSKNRKYKSKQRGRNNTEIVIGLCISLLFILVFFAFRTNNGIDNATLLSGLMGGLGAIIAILLSISFSKRSNEQTLDSLVLPYLIVKKVNNQPDTFIAFEYFSDDNNLFTGWRSFDFSLIKNNKRALVRNGIAYLRIENIGLGPAKKIKIEVNGFGSLFLEKDYLQPNESMCIILNFNDPEKSQNADLTIRYDTIRNVQHMQEFSASITWHLDRTNFTLYS